MKLKISVALACLLLAQPAAAQDVEALAREYIALPAVQDSLLNALSPEFIGGFVLSSLPSDIKVSPEKQAAISQVIADRMAKMRPAMEESLIDVAASTFTAAELEAMNAFIRTEAGASSTRKGAIFAAKFNEAIMPELQRMGTEIRPEIMQILVQ